MNCIDMKNMNRLNIILSSRQLISDCESQIFKQLLKASPGGKLNS